MSRRQAVSGRSSSRTRSLALSLGLVSASCAGPASVERLYGTQFVEGRPIEPHAYAAFLRGALDEAAADTRGALAEYGTALRTDPSSPELWARIAALRCALDARDPAAEDALRHAVSSDPGYAGAWMARAGCARARGDDEGAALAADQAAALDPSLDGALSPAWMARRDPRDRASILATTVAAPDATVAFRAFADWAERHGDVDLRARALIALVRVAPLQRGRVAREAEAIAGEGALRQARAVAAAVVDAWEQPLAEATPSLTARLAVDDAIDRKDEGLVRRRAVRARVPLAQAAARALLVGHSALARRLAWQVVRASPSDGSARQVLRAADRAAGGPGLIEDGPPPPPPKGGSGVAPGGTADAPISAEAWVALGVALASSDRADGARAMLASVVHDPLPLGDDRVLRVAVELAWRGVIDATAMPADGALELRALRGTPVVAGEGEGAGTASTGMLDERHQFLELALLRPRDARAALLGVRLVRASPDDRVVAVARELAAVGQGIPTTPSQAQRLLARDPNDPLVAVTALRLAERCGDPDTARRARAAVAALAGRSAAPSMQ